MPTPQKSSKTDFVSRRRVRRRGEAGTKDYRVHVLAKANEDNTTIAEISLWHDVPLVAPGAGTKLRAFSLWPRRGGATCG